MTEHALRLVGGVTPKLHDHHLRRQAMVYVRQSHPLGLRGMMSEAELHILKGRMLEGMRHKA